MRAHKHVTVPILLFCLALPATASASKPSGGGAAISDPGAVPRSLALRFAEGRAAPLRVTGSPARHELRAARAGFVEALAAFRRDRRRFDLRMLSDLSRAAIRALGGPAVPDRQEPSSPEADQPLHLAFGAGDLNGDSKADLFDLLIDGTPYVVALRGDNGAELWRLPVTGSDAFPIPLGDATGDGRDDVLLIELSAVESAGAGDCAPLAPCYLAEGHRFTWTISVRSGADGRAVWSRQSHGVVAAGSADAFTPGAFVTAGSMFATNAVLFPFPAGDHDDDGLQDIVLNELDLANPFVYGTHYSESTSTLALAAALINGNKASVIDGDTGLALAGRTSVTPGLAYLAPVPDVTGDGVTDLLWDEDVFAAPVRACTFPHPEPDGVCAGPELERRTAEIVDGATLLTRWTAELGGHGFVYPAGGDITGDGKGDLVFLGFDESGPVSSVLHGPTGEVAWSSTDVVLGAVAAPGGDPIATSVAFLFGDTTFDYEIRRRAGADGSLISSTLHQVVLPTDAFDLFILAEFWVIADADGDGSADTLSQVTIEANETSGDLWVERGVDGGEIFSRAGVGVPYAVSVPDMDGDGNSDLLDIGQVAHRRSHEIAFTGRSLPGATPVWTMTRSLYRDSFVWIGTTGDLTGSGGADIVLSWIQRPPHGFLESAIEPVEQTDGSIPWVSGGPLSVPPAPATGGISGTVTGEGAPFAGACVSATSLDGSETAFVMARNGEYMLSELDDGDHLIWFGDCMFDAYVPEWFDGAPDESEATPVTVAGGAVTGPVDADLAAR